MLFKVEHFLQLTYVSCCDWRRRGSGLQISVLLACSGQLISVGICINLDHLEIGKMSRETNFEKSVVNHFLSDSYHRKTEKIL